MLKNILLILFILCGIGSKVIYAGLIDSIAAANTKNASIAEGLPQKKNISSKYSCLLNKNKKPLETALDAHNPIKYKLEDAPKKNLDVNKLSEKQLEAIGDAAIAEKLTEKPRSTSKKPATYKKGGKSSTKSHEEEEKCED